MTATASPVRRLLRVLVTDVLLPCGVALAAGAAAATLTPAHWRAPGLPYVLGYGKNVESAAMTAAFVAGALTPWLAERRAWRPAVALVAAAGWGALVAFADLGALAVGWWQVVSVVGLVLALRLQTRTAVERPVADDADVSVTLTLVAVLWLALAAFVIALEALTIDVFHHGEVLASAVDLLQGGRPFESFIWPHGLHDTGLAAAWIVATGKLGTSPVALARATCRGFAIVALAVTAWRVLGTRRAAVAVAAALATVTALASATAASVDQAHAMHQLGIVLPVAVGFVALTHGGRTSLLVAGGCFALAHLFRIEVGLFGLTAALALLAHRHSSDTERSWPARMRDLVASAATLMVGAVVVLATWAWVVGWPSGAWFVDTLRELPRYHRDAVGLPFPWPLAHSRLPPAPVELRQVALGWLLFVVLLLGQAVRAALGWRDRPRAGMVVFLAAFAWLATRSSLDRSDAAHVLQWCHLPLLGTIVLAAAIARDRFGWHPRRTAAVAALAIACFDTTRMAWMPPSWVAPGDLRARLVSAGALLGEHLAPNPPVGACADRLFTPTEARIDDDARFIADTCTVEQTLAAHHVERVVFQHSAPWYEVRFAQPRLTRFFAFARAYTPERQRELVNDLRAGRPQALLRVSGYHALTVFDLADGLRVPAVDAYLRARRHGVPATATPLGDLFLWDEPSRCAPAPPVDGTDGFHLAVDHLVYQPDAAVLFAEGWAADMDAKRALATLALRVGALPAADFEYGAPRPDVAAVFGAPALTASGWQLAVSMPAAEWERWRVDGRLVLDGTSADGRHVSHTVPSAEATALPPLDGAEWHDAATIVASAAAAGQADRRTVCGAACDCP